MAGPHRSRALVFAALAAVFLAAALWQSAPALRGDFLADDRSYIVENVYVHELSWENLAVLLDPWGEPTAYTANYAPVHLIVHALEYAAFGPKNMLGWHVVNVVLHVVTSLLLVAYLLQVARLPLSAAALGGALFLVHPANAETVAWIFQLKTLLALGLALGALLLLERRPGLATLLFVLALLTKITALFALPVVAAQAWVRSRDGAPPRLAWIGAWAGLGLAVGVLELHAYGVQEDPRSSIHEDVLVHARTIVAIAMRYLAMAYAGWGLSAFQEPPPATSWLDPWWLGGLVALSLLGGRTWVTLRRRDEEAIFWILAAASFAPVSQVFPFIYPMGDRYLYPILPGLIGGTFLALRGPVQWLRSRVGEGEGSFAFRAGAVVAAVLVLAPLAFRSAERSAAYRDTWAMMMDAAVHYPDGLQAHLLRGFRAAQHGDGAAAARSYGRAVELGFSDLHVLLSHRSLDAVRDHPDFQAMLRDLADRNVRRIEKREEPSQMELHVLGRAYEVAGRPERAVEAYERALELEGPLRPWLRRRVSQLRGAGATLPADPPGS